MSYAIASPLSRYTAAATASSAVVIRRYSTSFGLACRLLAPQLRPEIENIYALVRLADEVVDGAATGAGLAAPAVLEQLDTLEGETYAALTLGYSTNLVVHAFVQTARRAGIGRDLVTPFFASMRRDCDPHAHSGDSLGEYIYGSAEVVGLMCLRAFLADAASTPAERAVMAESARRLGAAFQKVNFLRDLGQDAAQLGRQYFPGVDPGHLHELQKAALVADLRADLAASLPGVRLLPDSSRRAVALAHAIFSELADRIDACPAELLPTTRVSVPTATKARLAAAALLGRVPGRAA
ncbi:phytoene/squalene synthase family protein [Sinomonas terrae]|uniref:Squalene/phytoene synthase family protein n=1 Tax=Sinomonas terrae TaxID=2908838 RepID=A0ABS9U7G4_9MICC|nr:squalene/phytoene synthase family protein [Sinomonas terrae]MCH6472302.1 squalene/phytoene synthase family protein [Sinomonas terrae]